MTGFLGRVWYALDWGLGRLREALAAWRSVAPCRARRVFRGGDVFDLATFNARERAARRSHWRFCRRVFVYAFTRELVYAYVYICLQGGDGYLFRAPFVQEQILARALDLATDIVRGAQE